MQMSAFTKRAEEIFKEEPNNETCELLKTIRMPKNLMYLSNRLPNANYDLRKSGNDSIKIIGSGG